MKTILALNFSLPGSDSGALPQELLLIPAGSFTGRDGRSWRNNNPIAVINRVQDYGLDLAVDIEHATEIKGPKAEAAPAMAWIPAAALFVRDGAIWGVVKWTKEGKALIEDKKYRYYSPEFCKIVVPFTTLLALQFHQRFESLYRDSAIRRLRALGT